MADNHSFDIVAKLDYPELQNAIHQAQKEVETRFDLKQAEPSFEFNPDQHQLLLGAVDEHSLKAIIEVIKAKAIKRQVPVKAFDYDPVEQALGGKVKQTVRFQNGMPADKSKQIVKDLKGFNKKLSASIQGDQIRVNSKKIDDLQAAMQFLKSKDYGIYMSFKNYR